MYTIDKIARKLDILPSFGEGTGTPLSLARNLVSTLTIDWKDPNLRIIDPACGVGTILLASIEKLLENDHNIDDIIKYMVYGVDIDPVQCMLTRSAFKMLSNAPPNILCEDSLDTNREWNMKFDAAVGNWPYGDANDSGGINWLKFTNLCFDVLLYDNGEIGAIHPPSFIGKHLYKGTGKSDYTVFKNNQINELHIFDDNEKNKYFSKEGTKISWFVGRKSLPIKKTKIVGYDNNKTYVFESDFHRQGLLPSVINERSMNIHSKLINQPSMKFVQKRELHYHTMKKKNQVNENITETRFPYKSYFSHLLVRGANYKFSDYSDVKVMIPQTSTISNAFIDKNCNVSEDLFYINCGKDIKKAKEKLEYLQSDIVTYIGKMYRPGRALGALFYSNIIPESIKNVKFSKEELEYINEYN